MPASPATEFRELPKTERPAGAMRADNGFRLAMEGRSPALELQANLISALGAILCLSAGSVLLLAGAPTLLAAALFSLGALCDLVDGVVARKALRRVASKAGKFVDSIADKVGEMAIWLALLVIFRNDSMVFLFVLPAFGLGLLTSFLKAFAEAGQLDLDWTEARVFGRAGRAILLATTLWLAALPALVSPEPVLIAGFAVLLAFNCATCVWRSLLVAGALAPSWRGFFTR